MSLETALDATINGGAYKCLALIRSLAGHARILRTLTKSLATQLGVCTNTIRNYRDALVEAGCIWWQTNQKTGITTIMIREKVEPPSRRARLEAERQAEAWPRAPQPARWGGGAQTLSPIKASKKDSSFIQWGLPVDNWKRGSGSGAQLPIRTVAEQIAAMLSP
jgi:hypothetical protein